MEEFYRGWEDGVKDAIAKAGQLPIEHNGNFVDDYSEGYIRGFNFWCVEID